MKTLEIGNYIVVDLPTGKIDEIHKVRIQFHSDKISTLTEYKPIGFGKDHPELIQELGILSDNPVEKPVFKKDRNNRVDAISRYNQQLVEREESEKRVFKNPFILEKV